jgi:hypothetical protein
MQSGLLLHQIKCNQPERDKRRDDRDEEGPAGMQPPMSSACQKYCDGFERALSHAATVPFRA